MTACSTVAAMRLNGSFAGSKAIAGFSPVSTNWTCCLPDSSSSPSLSRLYGLVLTLPSQILEARGRLAFFRVIRFPEERHEFTRHFDSRNQRTDQTRQFPSGVFLSGEIAAGDRRGKPPCVAHHPGHPE